MRGVPPLVDRFAGFERAIASALQGRYDVGVIEHFWCAPYAAILKTHCERLLLNLHNIESNLLDRSRAGESLPARLLLARFAAVCRRLEGRWYPEFDHLLVASKNDAYAVGERAVVYPNAIPWFDLPATPKKEEIVFSGNLEYHPNKRALRFFYDNIWPSLRRRYPDLIWQNVGRNHEWATAAFSSDRRVRFTGPVDNAIEALAGARVAVVPLLAGSGTRFKIIEAWAAGTPVVSTTVGAEGLPGVDGVHLLIADTPEDFIGAVTAVLDNDDFSHQLWAAGRRLYEECLTWHAAWEILSARLSI
jgi:glycosyltransferase involved in cell wall biosynthesis